MSNKGRPTVYTEELAKEICDRLASGESVRSMCKLDHMPTRQTIYVWHETKPEFFDRYTRARKAGADELVDEILEIADNTISANNNVEVQAATLRIKAREYFAKVTHPEMYSDKQRIDHSSTDGSMSPNKALEGEELDKALKERGIKPQFDE